MTNKDESVEKNTESTVEETNVNKILMIQLNKLKKVKVIYKMKQIERNV